jgi:Spy/CpxP family protein refolding chaperone
MTYRSICHSLLPLASFALCSSLALSQQTPPPASTDTPPPAAPVERQPPSNPAMPRGPMQGNMRPNMMQQKMHERMAQRGSDFHGGPRGHMGGGFHIAPPGMWWKNPRLVERLALTPEQTKKMDSIFQESRLQLIDLHANVEKQEVMLEPMLNANPVDTARTMAQIDKVAQARADLEKADAKMLLGIRGVLTPEQWTKLNSRDFGPAGQGGPAPGGPGGGWSHGPRGNGPGGPSLEVPPIDQP